MSQDKPIKYPDIFDPSLTGIVPQLDITPITTGEPQHDEFNFNPVNFNLSLPDLDNYQELPEDDTQLTELTEPVVTGLTEMPPGIAKKLIMENKDIGREGFADRMMTSNAFMVHSAMGPLFGKSLTRSTIAGTERFNHFLQKIDHPKNILETKALTYTTPGLAWRFAKRIMELEKQAAEQGRLDAPVYILNGLGYDLLKAGADIVSIPLKAIMKLEQSQIRKAYPDVEADPESLGAAKADMAKEIVNELGGMFYPGTSYALTGERYRLGDWLWDSTGKIKDSVVKVLGKVLSSVTKQKETVQARVEAIRNMFGIDTPLFRAPVYALTAVEKAIGAAKWAIDHATLKDLATVWTMVAEDPIMWMGFGEAKVLTKARPVIDSLSTVNPTRPFLNLMAKAAIKDPEGFKLLFLEGREAAKGSEALNIMQKLFKPKPEWEKVAEVMSEKMKPLIVKDMTMMPIESAADWTAIKTLEKVARANPDAIDAYIEVVRKLGGKDPLYASLRELGKARVYGFKIADEVVPFTDLLLSKNKTLISLFYKSVGMATHDIEKILRTSGISKDNPEYYTKVQGLLTFLRTRMRNLSAHGMEDVDKLQDALAVVFKELKNKGVEYGIKPEDINFIQATVIQRFFGSSKVSGEKVLQMYVKEGKIHQALQYSPLYRDMNIVSMKFNKGLSKAEDGVLDAAVKGYRHGSIELNKEMAERFYRIFSDEQTRKYLADPEVQEGIRTVIDINEEILKRETDPSNVFIQALRGEILTAQMTSKIEDFNIKNVSQFYDLFRNKGLQNPYLRYTYNHIWRIDKKTLGQLPRRVRRRIVSFLTDTIDTAWKHRKLVFPVDPFNKTLIDILVDNKALGEKEVDKLYKLASVGGKRAIKAEQEAFRIVKNALHRWIDKDGINAVKMIEQLEHGGMAYFPAIHEIDAAARSGYLFGKPVEGFIETNPIIATQMRLHLAAKAFAKEKVAYEMKTQLLKQGWAVPLPSKAGPATEIIERLSRETGIPWTRGIGPLRDIAIPMEIDNAIKKYINYFLAPNPDKSKLEEGIKRFTRWWKRMMTIYFPGFHSRNAITNFVLSEMNGIKLLTTDIGRRSMSEALELVNRVRKVDKDVIEGLAKRGRVAQLEPIKEVTKPPADIMSIVRSIESPQFQPSKQTVSEILRMTREAATSDLPNVVDKYITTVAGQKISYSQLIDEMAKHQVMGGWVREELGKGGVSKLTKIAAGAGEVIEGHARVSAYIYLRKLGYSPEAAGEWVARTFFNYNELPKATKYVRETAIPFASWYYFTLLGPNNIMKLLARNPKWLVSPLRLRQYLEWKMKLNPLALPNIYWESWGMPLGVDWKYKNGERQPIVNFAPLASYLPQFNINMYFHPMKSMMDMSHPIIKMLAETITGRRFFSGKDIELYGTKVRHILGLKISETVEHMMNTMLRAPRELQRASRVLGFIEKPEGELATEDKFLNFIKLMIGLNTYGAMGTKIMEQKIYRVERNIKLLERQARKAQADGDLVEFNDLVRQIRALRLILDSLKKVRGSL